jgi:hypothetical protein
VPSHRRKQKWFLVQLTADSSAFQVILRSVRSFLVGQPDSEFEALVLQDVNWEHVWILAAENKLTTAVLRGLQNLDPEQFPEELLSALTSSYDVIRGINSRVLSTAHYLDQAFLASEINSVMIKGPLDQLRLYGDLFIRPTADLDILVPDEQFACAGRVLEQNGFAVVEECRSPWWRTFLGEQHYVSLSGRHAVVDLHRRIQMPGCPSPRLRNRFFSGKQKVRVDSKELSTVSDTNSVLVCCMSMVKSLVHKEPAGHYACDLAAHILSERIDWNELRREAEEQGLLNTTLLTVGITTDFFDLPAVLEHRGREMPISLLGGDLARGVLSPSSGHLPRLRGLQILPLLCDSKRDFVREFAWKSGAEITRRFLQRLRFASEREKPGE